MSSRQDQLHSYQFMIQRVVAALVMRETDPARSPFRRAAGATLASVLIAVIAVGAVAAYGAIVGGGATGWRDPSVVIVEKESGARYVYRDEKLHPVLNYASALLIAESARPRTVLVSRASMEGVPRGVPLGIPDAPDSLAAPDRLTSAPWTVCSAPLDDRRKSVRSVLLVGVTADGGRVLQDEAVLAQHPDGSLHLLWRQHRHRVRVPEQDLAFTALGWAGARPVPVAPALLNVLPAGADLAPVPIASRGEWSEMVGAQIGQVFVVKSLSGEQHYVVAKRDGLAGVTQMQAVLLLAVSGQGEPTELPQGRFARLPRLPDLSPADAGAPPAAPPRLAAVDSGVLCGQIRDDRGAPQLRIEVAPPDVADLGTGARSPAGGALADHIVVAPGRGAVVEAAASPGATGGAICVVTDLGRRYPVTDAEVLTLLGYDEVQPLRLPAGLVALVPAGPALDPAAARTPAIGSA
ncbi:MAG TPA: type VII secretion protein EccB [Micromonospora sp.]|nr:type VII secretion protein EccB [Micromonospora sp.]